MRQYQSMGDLLDRCRVYGYRGAIENMLRGDTDMESENGHGWLTQERRGDDCEG